MVLRIEGYLSVWSLVMNVNSQGSNQYTVIAINCMILVMGNDQSNTYILVHVYRKINTNKRVQLNFVWTNMSDSKDPG
jgi:hypothetical protein